MGPTADGPPRRGEVWLVDLDPSRGHEQGGVRPALVVSDDRFNAGPAELVVVVPITSRDKGIASHVRLEPPEGGLRAPSFAKAEDVRSISTLRLRQRQGSVHTSTLRQVDEWLRVLLAL